MPNFYEYNPEQGVFVAAEREGRAGGKSSVFFRASGGGEAGFVGVRGGLQRGGAAGVSSGDAVEGVAVRVCAGDDQFAAVGGADPGGFGISVFGGRSAAGLLGVERFSKKARTSDERRVHAGGGVGAVGGDGKAGHVAIDSTRIAANAAADSAETIEKLRAERAKIRKRIRRWQQQCDGEGPNEGAGTELATEDVRKLEERLRQIPARIERLQKSGAKKLSRVDADSRFLRERRGFTLGYTATVAVSEDHLIVAQQVSQASTDNDLLIAMVQRVERECRERPGEVSADSGFFSLREFASDGGMPDRGLRAGHNLARVLNRGGRLKQHACDPAHQRMRRKLRSPEGQRKYRRRKEIVEPIWGVLKEQRGMRRFRMRGLTKVAVEFTFAVTALNLSRLWRVNPQLSQTA